MSKGFPKEETCSLTDQVRRSSRSVCAHLGEAWRRTGSSKPDVVFHLDMQVAGDALSDVEAALAVGAQPLMVLTGRGREQISRLSGSREAQVLLFEGLLQAMTWILERESAWGQ